jgi:hypothetical protein
VYGIFNLLSFLIKLVVVIVFVVNCGTNIHPLSTIAIALININSNLAQVYHNCLIFKPPNFSKFYFLVTNRAKKVPEKKIKR